MHFSLQYLRFCRQKSWSATLYTFHQDAKNQQVYTLGDTGVIKVFPVKFRFPPFHRFGNDHNPRCIVQEMLKDKPDLVHFHNYYVLSFPYTAFFVKKKLKRPLVAQLHGYNNGNVRKTLYLPCLLALKNVDSILYSYQPEENMYRKLGVIDKAVKVPVPGVDPQVFKLERRSHSNRLLYVGRIPKPETAHGEKSPYLLLHLLRNLLRRQKDAVLDVVGDGPGLGNCHHLTRSLGLADNVVFHGYVLHSDLPKYYRASALTFSPIQVHDIDGWFDGALQESLACGTPVAAFKASPRTPLRGTYGFLLSNNTARAAAEVSELLRTPEEMNQVAQEGSRFVRENCSYAKVAETLQGTWERAIET
jgi:glycosyltransferase involved in cell wall biosynthesis